MTNKIYNVTILASMLEMLRSYILSNQEAVVTGPRGINVLVEGTYDQVQDMLYADLDPATGIAYTYTHYLAKHPEGSSQYLFAVHYAISSIANEVLIDEDGSCNYENHRALEIHGFRVRCGSSDSFGWLSGRICCSDFEFMYG